MSHRTVRFSDANKHICLRIEVKRYQSRATFFPKQLYFIIDVTTRCGGLHVI